MEITYMQQMINNPILKGFKNESFKLDKIEQLEAKYNNASKFPQAFREYLFIGGKFNNISFDEIDGIEELQEYAKEEIQTVSMTIKRPFFAFDVYDSQYSIIFLDEENEDPTVYLLRPFIAQEDGTPLVEPYGLVFSDLVNKTIARIKNNFPK